MVPKGKKPAFSENESKFLTSMIEGYFVKVFEYWRIRYRNEYEHSFIKNGPLKQF